MLLLYHILTPVHLTALQLACLDSEVELNTDVDVTSYTHVSNQISQTFRDVGGNLPILTTLDSWTDFSAAVCRSSMEKILRPESLMSW